MNEMKKFLGKHLQRLAPGGRPPCNKEESMSVSDHSDHAPVTSTGGGTDDEPFPDVKDFTGSRGSATPELPPPAPAAPTRKRTPIVNNPDGKLAPGG